MFWFWSLETESVGEFTPFNETRDLSSLVLNGSKADVHPIQHSTWPIGKPFNCSCPSQSLRFVISRYSLLGEDVTRLNDSTGSQEDVVHWPNTFGYIYRSNGEPISEEATKHAYEIFTAIKAEVRNYYGRDFKNLKTNRVLKVRAQKVRKF